MQNTARSCQNEPRTWEEDMLAAFSHDQRRRLHHARIGIAGAGGLGSQAAMMLARCGIGTLILADGDCIEASNLNRQHYFPKHIGMPKVHALAEQLKQLRPGISLSIHHSWLGEHNLSAVLAEADVWIEAMDSPSQKARFVSGALCLGKRVICASGMGGIGKKNMTRRVIHGGRLIAVGDFTADTADMPALAPRVTQCAAMQADAALELILTGTVLPLL